MLAMVASILQTTYTLALFRHKSGALIIGGCMMGFFTQLRHPLRSLDLEREATGVDICRLTGMPLSGES